MHFQSDVDESVSVTSGSMSPDLGDMWKYGCPKSPDWGSDIDFWTEGEEFSEDVTRNLRQVWEGPLLGRNVALSGALSGALGCPRNASDGQQMECPQ